MKRFFAWLLFLISVATAQAFAKDSLLYIEAQGVAGYSSKADKIIYHSGYKYDAMQKNSIGFDYLKKFSGEYGDAGTGALQMRLTYDDSEGDKAEVQIYNAYLLSKTKWGDVWAGHNRVAFGLASYWDTHADLLQPLSMCGFGFDRDWGVGFSKDAQKSDVKLAVTTGSGMGIKLRGNYLATLRSSYGVLSRDNYNVGMSVMGGKKLDAIGYKIMKKEPEKTLLAAIAAAYNFDRFEQKAEIDFGEMEERQAVAALYRASMNFLYENRLKLDSQTIWTKRDNVSDLGLGAGATYKINSDLTFRVMYQWWKNENERVVAAQLYYYFGV